MTSLLILTVPPIRARTQCIFANDLTTPSSSGKVAIRSSDRVGQGGQMSKQFLAIGLITLMCVSNALAKPKHTVERGAPLIIDTHLIPNVNVQSAALTWRTYDDVSSNQKLMATSFHCDADVVANSTSLTLSCKVPLYVADATYYLTSISIKTDDSERTYRWQDEPFDIEVRVRGGERITPPYILSVRLQ
jgi:hypothetical protein